MNLDYKGFGDLYLVIILSLLRILCFWNFLKTGLLQESFGKTYIVKIEKGLAIVSDLFNFFLIYKFFLLQRYRLKNILSFERR
jgi:hypothetical protein